MSKIRQIQALFRNGLYYLTEHVNEEATADSFDIYDVEHGILTCKIRKTRTKEGKYKEGKQNEVLGSALDGRPIGIYAA